MQENSLQLELDPGQTKLWELIQHSSKNPLLPGTGATWCGLP